MTDLTYPFDFGMPRWWRVVRISAWPSLRMTHEGQRAVLAWLNQREFTRFVTSDKEKN